MSNYSLLPIDIFISPTPSVKDGIDSKTEYTHRLMGCELVQEAGILLRLPQVVMVTGQNILNRFFYRYESGPCKSDCKHLKTDVLIFFIEQKVSSSFRCIHSCHGMRVAGIQGGGEIQNVERGLICQVCTIPLHERELENTFIQVIYIFHRMYLRRKRLNLVALELGGGEYTRWKSELITMEMYVLKELGFALYSVMDHPHKYLLYFIKMLRGDNALAQLAWNYLNDSMRLTLSLQHKAQTIACAAIYLAARKLQFALPQTPQPWWRIMDAELSTVQRICDDILRLYAQPQVTLRLV